MADTEFARRGDRTARKPPCPVALVPVRCWACGGLITEAEPGRWLRTRCHRCKAWTCAPTPAADVAA